MTLPSFVDIRNVASGPLAGLCRGALGAGARLQAAFAGVGNVGARDTPSQIRVPDHYDVSALDAWARAGQPYERRADAAQRIRAYLADPGGTSLGLAGLKLIALPPLPPGLTHLNVCNNLLSEPLMLPAGLIHLACSDNPLPTVPALPPSLRILEINHVRTTVLPALPDGLLELHAHGCGLTTPPSAWPPALEVLSLGNNALTAIPALPSTITFSDLSGNNRLGDLQPAPLGEVVAAWYDASPEADQAAVEWARIEQTVNDDVAEGAAAFSRLLAWLADLPSAAHDDVRRIMVALIDAMACRSALRTTAFRLAQEAQPSDTQQSAWLLNQLCREKWSDDIASGLLDDRPDDLVRLTRHLHRLAGLEQIAQEKVAAIAEAQQTSTDEIDRALVHLSFETGLRDRLQLPLLDVGTFRAPEVTAADLDGAALRIEAEAARFAQFLSDWAPWRHVLTRWDSSRVTAATARVYYLRTEGAGKPAPEALRHQVYGPITRDYLRDKAPGSLPGVGQSQ